MACGSPQLDTHVTLPGQLQNMTTFGKVFNLVCYYWRFNLGFINLSILSIYYQTVITNICFVGQNI